MMAAKSKAFLNQMSMRYHQYIRHELQDIQVTASSFDLARTLQERKAERKRLRERAEAKRYCAVSTAA